MFGLSFPDPPDFVAALPAVEAAARRALDDGMARVATRAAAEHVFVTRTGTLAASIVAVPATGGLASGLDASVEATAEYADFVVASTGDDFLAAALDAELPAIERELEAAIQAALDGYLGD